MNKFQILNKEGNPITMGELDKEAAALWNKEVKEKDYAHPYPERTDGSMKAMIENAENQSQNWFDVIGWRIANLEEYSSGWDAVAEQLMKEVFCVGLLRTEDTISFATTEEAEMWIKCVAERYQPYIDLINYWKGKGYTPKQIKD